MVRAQLVSLRQFIGYLKPGALGRQCITAPLRSLKQKQHVHVGGAHAFTSRATYRQLPDLRPSLQTRALAHEVDLSFNALKRTAAELESRLQDIIKVGPCLNLQRRLPLYPRLLIMPCTASNHR
jgi:hypothetical protein